MGFTEKLKIALAVKSIENKKKKNPFDQYFSEHFQLPQGADSSMNNSYYFSGHDQLGNSLLFRLGQRGGGEYEVWFAIKDSDGGVFVNRNQSFKLIKSKGNSQANNNTYHKPEVTVSCLETGKKWAFSFEGETYRVNPGQNKITKQLNDKVRINFKGIFDASSDIFEFSRHMDSGVLAKAIAREKWNRSFFKNINNNHQTHYEQAGEISGILTLNREERNIRIRAIRDHSFGKRDWDYMDRHIWILALLENGDVLNISMVRYPAVRELQSGYLISGHIAGNSNGNLDSSASCNFQKNSTVCLYRSTSIDEIECSGYVPDKLNLFVTLSDGTNLNVFCEKELELIFPFDNGVYTIHEGIGHFKCNGIKGRGIIEFGFNKDPSRWGRAKTCKE